MSLVQEWYDDEHYAVLPRRAHDHCITREQLGKVLEKVGDRFGKHDSSATYLGVEVASIMIGVLLIVEELYGRE